MERGGEPAADQADHLMRPHPYGLVPLAQLFTHFWGGSEYAQERQGPALLGPGKRHDDCHHDPAQSWAADFLFSAGESTVTVMPSFADLAAPASFERFINHQIDTSACWDKGLDNEKQELVTHR